MKEEFEILITKFLEGRLTTEEEKQLNDWLNDDPGHQKARDDKEDVNPDIAAR